MSYFLNEADGSYSLTTPGIIACIVLIAIVFVIVAQVVYKMNNKIQFTTRQMVIIAVMLALATVTSNIKIFSMPYGGSVTLFSMLFVCLLGYWYGATIGMLSATMYSILQFLLGGRTYILSFWQVGFDYIFAFAALGLAGFFCKKKYGLIIGYIISIIVRGAMASVAGYLYWMEYMPEDFPKSISAIYPIVYNYSYILAEGLLTVIILCIPAVKKALAQTKNMIRES